MSLKEPPITEPLVDKDGLSSLAWALFFEQNYRGDTGTPWAPNFVNLAVSGAPEITGRYYKISQELCFFHIHIVPSTDTTATAGSTYCDNFPLNVTRNGVCFAVTGVLGSNAGIVQESTNRIYVPGWSSVTVPVTVVGFVEAK